MSGRTRLACPFFMLVGTAILAGCATSAGIGDTGSNITGDENGGRISSSVGRSNSRQVSAFQMVTAYCLKFEKKGFITQMDFETGVMTFECRRQIPLKDKR
jgi:hypothetical protein